MRSTSTVGQVKVRMSRLDFWRVEQARQRRGCAIRKEAEKSTSGGGIPLPSIRSGPASKNTHAVLGKKLPPSLFLDVRRIDSVRPPFPLDNRSTSSSRRRSRRRHSTCIGLGVFGERRFPRCDGSDRGAEGAAR